MALYPLTLALSPGGGEGGRGKSRGGGLLLSVQKAPQLLGAARVSELAQGLRFYLANPLARDVELLAHTRHRISWTNPEEPTIWLAIHY